MKSDDIRERVISIKSREGENKEREEKKKRSFQKSIASHSKPFPAARTRHKLQSLETLFLSRF